MRTASGTLHQQVAATLRAEMAGRTPRLTGIDLARVLNCSQQSASARMRGEVPLTLDDLPLVCEWLGVPEGEFLARAKASA